MKRTTFPQNAQGAIHDQKALELRMSGMSYGAIAAAIGISKSTAFTAVERALKSIEEQTKHQAKTYRSLETVRLDALLKSVWELAEGGSIPHIKIALKIMEQRSKLLGLYAPAHIKVETETISDEELINKFRDAYARVTSANSGSGEEGAEASGGCSSGQPVIIPSKPALDTPRTEP